MKILRFSDLAYFYGFVHTAGILIRKTNIISLFGYIIINLLSLQINSKGTKADFFKWCY